MMFLIVALVFSLLQLALAFFLLVASIHGPDSLPLFTLSWLVIIQIILWYGFVIFRKSKNKHAAVCFIFMALIITASGPLMFFIAEQYDEYKRHDILTNTSIHDVRDELLLIEDGKPFGIRFSFKAEFPRSEYIYITPLLRPKADPLGRKPDPNDMQILRYSTSPPLKDHYYFKKGVTYDIEFEMVPRYLIEKHANTPGTMQASFCLQYPNENIQYLTTGMFEQAITTDSPDHYIVMIHGTTYGDIHTNNGPAYTINEYNPADFYNTYQMMNLEKCSTP